MIANMFCSFVGTIAFSVLFHVPSQYYKYCGFTGMVGWMCFYFCSRVMDDSVATFLATLLIVLCSRILAVWRKCPITVFLVSGIVPLVPGASVYHAAYYIGVNNTELAVSYGIYALKIAFSMVLGIVFIVSIPREWFRVEYWREQRKKKRVVR